MAEQKSYPLTGRRGQVYYDALGGPGFGECHLTSDALGHRIGTSGDVIRHRLRELEKLGLIHRTYRRVLNEAGELEVKRVIVEGGPGVDGAGS